VVAASLKKMAAAAVAAAAVELAREL